MTKVWLQLYHLLDFLYIKKPSNPVQDWMVYVVCSGCSGGFVELDKINRV